MICSKPFLGGTVSFPWLGIDKPIKTILRDPDIGTVYEKSTFKITFSGLLLPPAVNITLSSIISYIENLNGEFSITLSTDVNTQSLNIGEFDECNFMTFLHRIHLDATTKSTNYAYLNCGNSPLSAYK